LVGCAEERDSCQARTRHKRADRAGFRRDTLTPGLFIAPPPGFALAAMNFVVTPDGANGSIVSTETRVYATSVLARRRFAAYWRVIYPGSALIRRMWLRAIEHRALIRT
jgi:hypothetical protein